MNFKCVFTRLCFIFVVFFVVVEILFLALPKVVNLNAHKNEISSYISKELKADFSFNSVMYKTYPNFSVKVFLKETKISNIANADDIEFKVNLPKLIFNKLVLKELKIDKFNLNIIRYKDGTTNLDEILSQPIPFDLVTDDFDFNLNNYTAFIDDRLADTKSKIMGKTLSARIKHNIINTKINSEFLSQNEKASINLRLEMPKPDKKTGFKNVPKYILAEGEIKNLQPILFKEYLTKNFDKDLSDIQGVINAKFTTDANDNNSKKSLANIELNNLKFISKIKENSIIFPETTKLSGVFNFNNKNLEIEKLDISSNKFKILVDGKIKNFRTTNAKPNININILNAKSDALYWMLPSNLFTKNQEVKKLKGYGAYTDIDGKINIKGTTKKPELYGKVTCKNMWILDGLSSDTPKANIDIDLVKSRVNLDVKIWATKNEWVFVQGWSDIWDLNDSHYHIYSSQNVPLDITQKELVPISDVADFLIGPVPIMKITGLGNIDLVVTGSKENPSLHGAFNFKNTRASFNGIYFDLYNADGSVTFDDTLISFDTKKAMALGKPADLHGKSDIKNSKVTIDYVAQMNGVRIEELFKTLCTSPMLKDISKQVEMIDSVSGLTDMTLNINGLMTDIYEKDFMKFVQPSGVLKLHNVSAKLNAPSVPINNINGSIIFDDQKSDVNMNGKIYNSTVKIKGLLAQKSNLKIDAPNMYLSDAIRFMTTSKILTSQVLKYKDIDSNTTFNLSAKYNGNSDIVDLKKFDLSAKFKNKSSSNSKIDILSGNMNFKNGNLALNKINTKIYNTSALFDGKINNAIGKKPAINMDMSIYKLDFKFLNEIKSLTILPQKYSKLLNAYKNYKGIGSANLSINNNKLSGNIWLRDISFEHAILDYPFSLKSADLRLKNNNLNLNSVNASFAGTPIFMNGSIKNITKNPDLDVYFTSKLSKDFVNNYINTNLSYPINIIGEVLISSRIKGNSKSITMTPVIKFEENADIYYMGANLGDTNHIREIKSTIQHKDNKLFIKNLDAYKYIYAQNNKLYPLLTFNIKSDISFLKNGIYIDKAHIKTFNPINANLFNAFFKKSLVKNGNVSCDLKIKGYTNNPDIIGNVNIKNVEIPLYETIIKDLNLDFIPKKIDINASTTYMGSDINFVGILKKQNFSKIHFEKLEVHSNKLNLNRFLNYLNEISYSRPIQIVGKTHTGEKLPIETKNITIDYGACSVDELKYKNIVANNLSTKFKYLNNNFEMKDIFIETAGGALSGNVNYNFENANIKAKLKVDNVSANELSAATLDIENQIYGNLDGALDISTYGADDKERMKNLNGIMSFEITNGKMPKLGSIEYLLKAGNLIHSGITGLTINNVSNLLIPIKTGSFNVINGNIAINNGIAKDIKIYSQGKNLSILLQGNYDLVNAKADIYILGKLSKKFDTIFGPLGNASLNSIFNLIPGIHLDEMKDSELIQQINSIPELGLKSNQFRIFRAKIDGDINSENFVSIFEWIDK